MAIPQRVKEAAAEADQQLQALAAAPAPPVPTADTQPPAPPAPTADTQPPAPPAPTADTQPPAPTSPAPPAAPPTAAPTSQEAELQRLQQQLLTESGRTAARDAELAELRGRLQAMQDLLTAQRAGQPPAPAPAPPQSLITEADRQDFGEDMIDFVQRVMRQSLGATLDGLMNRIVALEGQLQRVGAQAQSAQKSAEEIAAEKYFGYLDTHVPGWRQTNDDSQFVDWLRNRDTFSRKTRHELLTSAHAEADAETVAAFFRAYWTEKGIAPAPAPAPSAPPPSPAAPHVDPSSLVAPTPSGSPTPSAHPASGKIWTEAEITQVYDDRMKKRISPEKFAELEAEINQAIIAGRVR